MHVPEAHPHITGRAINRKVLRTEASSRRQLVAAHSAYAISTRNTITVALLAAPRPASSSRAVSASGGTVADI
uniref:Uncharacterized protein n=1 Tax=Oryza sativa subsp. indica TaxID=39946 RepID=C5NNV1_ORYSI|nr:hypothetical protein [Oryza sativa Indica Group]